MRGVVVLVFTKSRWINIKKELFVNKRRHLQFVYVSNDSVFFFFFLATEFNPEMSRILILVFVNYGYVY